MKVHVTHVMFVVGVLLCAGSANAQDVASAPSPELAVTTKQILGSKAESRASLGDLFGNLPGLGKIQGGALVTIKTGLTQTTTPRPNRRRPTITYTPWRTVEITSKQLYFGIVPLGALNMKVSQTEPSKPTTMAISLKGVLVNLEGTLRLSNKVEFDPVSGQYDWDAGEMEGDLSFQSKGLSGAIFGKRFASWQTGPLDLTAKVRGESGAPLIRVEVKASNVRHQGRALGSVWLDWSHDKGQMSDIKGKLFLGQKGTTSLKLGEAPFSGAPSTEGALHLEALLPVTLDLHARDVTWRVTKKHDVRVSLEQALGPSILAPFMTLPSRVKFGLEKGSFEFKGSLAKHSMKADLRGKLDTPRLSGVLVQAGLSAGAKQSWTMKVSHNSSPVAFLDSEVETGLDLVEILHQSKSSAPSSVKAKVVGSMPMSVAEPWMPGLSRLQGLMQLNVGVSGSLGEPSLAGGVTLEEGQASVLALNRQLEKMKLSVGFVEQGFTYTFEGQSRPGSLRASGKASFDMTAEDATLKTPLWEDWSFKNEMTMAFVKAPFVHDSFPISLIDATMSAKTTWSPGKNITTIQVVKGDVVTTDEALPQTSTIPSNRELVFVDGKDPEGFGGLSSMLKGQGILDLTVEVLEPVGVSGPTTKMALGGKMRMVRRGEVVRVEGGLKPQEGGYFELYENRFEVQDGLLTLESGHIKRPARPSDSGAPVAAPLEPILSFVAQGDVSNTDVLVKLEGPMRQPTLILASQPPIPEYQIMTLLVTGRVDAVDDKNGNVRRSVARLVERYHNPSLKRQLFDRIGVDKLGLGFRSSVLNPVLTVGKQINKRLYIETVYRHGAPEDMNMMEGKIEHRLDPQWTVDTVFGDAAEGSFGLYWTTKFGGAPPAPFDQERWRKLSARAVVGDDDRDGIDNAFDLCPTQPEDLDQFEDEDGCADQDNDKDGIPDAKDKAPMRAETFNGFEDLDGVPDERVTGLDSLKLEDMLFNFEKNQSELGEEAKVRLQAFVRAMEVYPGYKILVRGHSDQTGSEETNLRVSKRRVQVMKNALIRAGVNRRQIETEVVGAKEPLSQESVDLNRRVQLVWVLNQEQKDVK